jgi:hypothetical protein
MQSTTATTTTTTTETTTETAVHRKRLKVTCVCRQHLNWYRLQLCNILRNNLVANGFDYSIFACILTSVNMQNSTATITYSLNKSGA